MATRNLDLEKKYVDQFFQTKGTGPSTPEDWKSIHTATYGSDLPPELAQLPMYQTTTQTTPVQTTQTDTQINTPSTPSTPTGINYRGADVSDTALNTARATYDQWSQPNSFLDQVKERLQQKFKPETETLGLGTFSATLGALDPSGVMQGINEKAGQFRRKGALALQALSTANDIYSEQAKLAADKLTRLENLRTSYETEQKTLESEMKQIALSLAQAGKTIPDEVLNLLPPNLKSAYQALPQIFADTGLGEGWYADNTATGNGWTGDELVIEKGSGNAYECGYWARGLGDYGQGTPMGNSFKEKSEWVDKFGTRGSQGLSVGDLVITDGSDVSKNGTPLATGHALIVGAIDKEGNIYAYESNAKGDKTVTFGRWVDPNAIYGSVKGTMKEGEFERMQNYAMKYNPASKGKPATTTKENTTFDNLMKLKLSPAEEMARLKVLAGDDENKLRSLVSQYDAYKVSKQDVSSSAFNNAAKLAVSGLKLTAADKELAMNDINSLLQEGNTDAVREQLKIYTFNSAGTEAQAKLEGKEDTVIALDNINTLIDKYEKAGGNLNVFTGLSESALQKLGKTTGTGELAELKSLMASAIIDYRKAVSGAAFTESEGAEYSKLFPSIGKTTALNKANISALQNKLKTDAEAFYRRRIGSDKYDTIYGKTTTPKSPSDYTSYTTFVTENPTQQSLVDKIIDELEVSGFSYDWQDVASMLEKLQ